MTIAVQQHFADLHSDDKEKRYEAYQQLMAATAQPVDWAYEVWDELVVLLANRDNHLRTIAAQLLCNLAISDPQNRMVDTMSAILEVTRDERFVTARHTLQAFWKIGLANDEMRAKTVNLLVNRFIECHTEKNCTLIRFDIIVGLHSLYSATQDEWILAKARELIELESDQKYQKKYLKVLK